MVPKAEPSPSCAFRPTRLRTNALHNPLGIQTLRPRLGWGLEATTEPAVRNATQSAYRIECFSSDDMSHLIWDSGRVASSETLHISYGGPSLRSTQRVYWRVTSWDGPSLPTACFPSPLAWFEVALVDDSDWHGAQWITRFPSKANVSDCELYAQSERNRAPRFRTEVVVPSGAQRVRAYVAGLGYHRVFVDGQRVGTSELDAGWATTAKTVLYSVLDLSELLLAGGPRHVVGVELGNGWWNPLPLRMWGHLNVRAALLEKLNGTREPMLRVVVLATMADGSTRPVTTTKVGGTSSWRTSGSPTVFNNIYLGERFDARIALATHGWSTLAYDVSEWGRGVAAGAHILGKLTALPIPPVRRQAVLTARKVSSTQLTDTTGAGTSTVSILDVGRNIAGGCTYHVSGPNGSVVSMRYGELLSPDGHLNVMTSVAGQIKSANPHAPCQPPLAFQGDSLVLSGRGGGDEWSTGAYSWHGFRFVEITLPVGAALVHDVTCYPLRTDVARVANFSSSSAQLNRLSTLNRHTFDANLMSVQSDCPHRERFGYGGDALGCGEAGLSIYDWEAFYAKRVRDYNDAQRVAGGGTGGAQPLGGFTETAPFVGIGDSSLGPKGSGPIGWQTFQPEAQLWLYKYYGDMHTLHESFNATHAFIRMLDAQPPGAVEHGLGDWMPLDATSTAFTGLGFERMAYLAFANMSSLVGAHALAREYTSKADAVAKQLNVRFLNASSGVYRTSIAKGAEREDTQCGQGMALFTGLCPDRTACSHALSVLVDNARTATSFLPHACRGNASLAGCTQAHGGPGAHLTAGLFGIKWALMALADSAMNDVVYEMLTQTSYPSYGWMMNNSFANATTLWESWFFSDNTFSHDHPMFSSSEVWLLQSVAGIQPHPAARGMSHVLIKPSPPSQLEACSAAFSTPRGRLAVSWRRSGGRFELNITIPPNVIATVHVPGDCKARELGGLDLRVARRIAGPRWGRAQEQQRACAGDSLAIEIGSGDFTFVTDLDDEL